MCQTRKHLKEGLPSFAKGVSDWLRGFCLYFWEHVLLFVRGAWEHVLLGHVLLGHVLLRHVLLGHVCWVLPSTLSTKPAKPSQPIGNPLWSVLLLQTIYMWKLWSGTSETCSACYNVLLIKFATCLLQVLACTRFWPNMASSEVLISVPRTDLD